LAERKHPILKIFGRASVFSILVLTPAAGQLQRRGLTGFVGISRAAARAKGVARSGDSSKTGSPGAEPVFFEILGDAVSQQLAAIIVRKRRPVEARTGGKHYGNFTNACQFGFRRRMFAW